MMTPSWISALANHLWQSTVFAIAIGVVAVAFRRYQARVRYALWFAASLKFFVPLSLLIGLGTHLAHVSPSAPAPSPILSTLVRQISVPFDDAIVAAPSSSAPRSSTAVGAMTIVFGIWVCGVLAIAGTRWRAWRHLTALVDDATESHWSGLAVPPHVEVRSVSGLIEPGVLGFIRPIILLPSGIDGYLNRDQLDAVLAHELCHIDRHDNLTAAVHMLVEAVFWFHPLVWWIGGRLIHERERACDEHVLATCGTPHVYAEGILNVCKHYLEAPLPCVAGVSGSNLKARIKTIIANRIGRRLSVEARMVLVLLGIGAIGVPLIVGAQVPRARPESDVAPIRRSPADSGMGVAIVAAQESATQSRPSAPASPTFEVASVKQNASGDGRVQMQMLPGNRINMTNVPARFLVAQAYQLQQFQLVGGPSWLTTDHYDIVAKLEGEPKPIVPGTPNPAMLALRTLLADRFKLKLHKETRDMDIYALVMVKQGVPGPGLKPSAIDCVAQSNARRGGPPPGPPPAPPGPNDPFTCGLGLMPGMVRMGGMPIGQLTQMLTGQSGRLVFDRTGLTGNWDLTLRFALEQGGGPPPPAGVNVPPVDPDAPSLFTALQEQLGLKLQSTKAPVDVTVIDSIEHPTDD